MKIFKYIIAVVFLLQSSILLCQKGVINQGANIVMKGDVTFDLRQADNDFVNLGINNADYGTIDLDGNIMLKGNWINYASNDVFINLNNIGNFIFDGDIVQTIGGNYKTNFESIEVNNPAGIELQSDISVSGTLSLNEGRIALLDYDLTLLENSQITGTFSSTNLILANGGNGFLQKVFGSTSETFTFPVGSYNGSLFEYSPAEFTINTGNLNNNATISVNVNDIKLAENTSETDYLERYWTVNQSNFTSINYNINFQYTDDDITGLEQNIYGAKYNETNVEFFEAVNAATNTISFQDIEGFSNFTGASKAVSVNDLKAISNINVYPNPGRGIFFISIENSVSSDLLITVYSAQGIELINDKLSQWQNQYGKIITKVNLENYPSGVYFIRIHSENISVLQKLIKE